jgi:hypothetical protein
MAITENGTDQYKEQMRTTRDRITNLLTKQSSAPTFSDEVGNISNSLLNALSTGRGAAGFQESYQQNQDQRSQQLKSQLEPQAQLYDMMQNEIKQGNAEATAIDKAIKDVTGDDVNAYSKIANILHNEPQAVNSANAPQFVMKAASQIGYQPLDYQKKQLDLKKLRTDIGKTQAEMGKIRAEAASKTGSKGINNAVDPVLARQVDKDVILKTRETAKSANDSIRSLQQLESLFFDSKGNPKVQTGKTQATLQFAGQVVPGVDSSTYQAATAITSRLGLDVSSMLKGQTSDKDVARSLLTVPSFSNEPSANKKIIKNQKAAFGVVSESPSFISQWRKNYGSTIGVDEQNRTFDEAYLDWQAKRFKELGGKKEDNIPTSNNVSVESLSDDELLQQLSQ